MKSTQNTFNCYELSLADGAAAETKNQQNFLKFLIKLFFCEARGLRGDLQIYVGGGTANIISNKNI